MLVTLKIWICSKCTGPSLIFSRRVRRERAELLMQEILITQRSTRLRLCFAVRTATYERSKVCLCVILHKRRAQFYCIAFAKLCELCVRFFLPDTNNWGYWSHTNKKLGTTIGICSNNNSSNHIIIVIATVVIMYERYTWCSLSNYCCPVNIDNSLFDG